jgi:hypothetical protein
MDRVIAAPLLLASALYAAGCAAPDVAGKWRAPSPEVDARVRRAELLLYEERPLEALAEARAAEALDPGSPDALRMLQAVRSAAGEDWQVRHEAEQGVRDRPDDPVALFLLARTESDPRRAERLLRRALDRDPALFWARLALAQLYLGKGEDRAAEKELALATATAPDHAWTALLGSQAAAARHRPGRCVALLREAIRRDPGSYRARETLARRLLDLPGGGPEAREELRACYLLAPRARAAASGWREALEAGASPDELRLAVEAVDAAEAAGLLIAQARHLRGAARVALGDADGALPDLRAALAAGEDRTAALDDLRAALFALGRYADALEAERACTPAGLLDDAESETAGIRPGIAAAARDLEARPGDREALARLAGLCRAAGWLRETALVEARRVALDPEDPAAVAGAEEAARTLRFLDEFRTLWKGAYFVYQAGGDGGDLDTALGALREISVRRLGIDLTDGLARRSFFFLGEMAESVRASGPAGEWFRRHGLALLLGRPAGQPVEARLLRVVSLHRDGNERILGRPCPATVVVGEGLLVPSRRESGGAVLGGATVGDLVFLDLQGVARWSGSATRARRDPAIRAALEAIPPLGPVDAEEAVSLRYPGRVTERIALSVESWADPRAALSDFLDAARCHELGHAADAERYLPVLGHPLAGLVLLLRGRLSGNGVAALLEGDAEIVAVASCREPRAALATLASFLPARDSAPPHSRGYFEALGELVAVLRERGAVPPGAVAARVLDGLDPDVIRSAAREVCRRRGLRR